MYGYTVTLFSFNTEDKCGDVYLGIVLRNQARLDLTVAVRGMASCIVLMQNKDPWRSVTRPPATNIIISVCWCIVGCGAPMMEQGAWMELADVSAFLIGAPTLCLTVCLYLSILSTIHLAIYLSIHLPIYPSTVLSICLQLSVLYIYLSKYSVM